jgi:D-ribose pyranase
MKKKGPLNSEITKVLADIGHTDTIVVADCGLPVPEGVRKIDLAIRLGQPSFLDVVAMLAEELQVEGVTVATEIHSHNKGVFDELTKLFPNAEFADVDHEEFKKRTKNAKAIIRTGEATPYANCILHAGVIF